MWIFALNDTGTSGITAKCEAEGSACILLLGDVVGCWAPLNSSLPRGTIADLHEYTMSTAEPWTGIVTVVEPRQIEAQPNIKVNSSKPETQPW